MEGHDRKSFGEWIRARRAELRLSLRAFATASGVDPGNLSKYERGLLPPPQDQERLHAMAIALQLRRGSDSYRHFLDLAAAGAGRIPPDLANDADLVKRLPLLFRTARDRRLTLEQVVELARRIRES